MALAEPIDLLEPTLAARRRGPLRPVALAPARKRIEPGQIARAFSLADTVLLVVAGLGALSTTGPLLSQPISAALPYLVAVVSARWMVKGFDLYGFRPRLGPASHLWHIACVALAAAASGWTAARVTGGSPPLAGLAGVGLTLTVAHLCWWSLVRAWRTAGRLTPNVVVVGATPNAVRLIEAAIASRDVAILGVFDDRASRSPDAVAGVPVLGDTGALLSHPLLPYVDRIVITVPASAQVRVRHLIDRLRVLPHAVTLFMDLDGAEARAATVGRLARTTTTQVSGADSDEARAFEKRIQDLILGTLALVVALPLMAVIALAVKLDSPGPALFRQRRHGFNNEAITVWKFRSMRVEAADATASRQVSRDDDRVTRVGRMIRKLSLDELPQLINVVRGEMSLVGPRPHAIGMKTAGEESAKLVAEYAWRHRMKPGLTGWAQINGSIGAVDTPEAVRRRVALDVEYIENQSLALDLYILLMTVPALIRARNLVR